MAEWRGNGGQRSCRRGQFNDLLLQARREKSIGIDRDHRDGNCDLRERRGYSPATTPDIMGVHRLGEHNVGVGIESLG